MTLNKLFSTFYIIFRFLHIQIDEYPNKIEKLTFWVGFFAAKKKTGHNLGTGYTLGIGRIFQVQIFTLQ